MNDRYYIDKLTYEVGEKVLYMGTITEITFIQDGGLVNLKDGWFYFFGVHPNMLYKILKTI